MAQFKSLYLLFKTDKLQNIIELAGGKCEIYNDQNLKKTKKSVYLFLNDTSGKHEHTQAKLQINLEKYKYNFKNIKVIPKIRNSVFTSFSKNLIF